MLNITEAYILLDELASYKSGSDNYYKYSIESIEENEYFALTGACCQIYSNKFVIEDRIIAIVDYKGDEIADLFIKYADGEGAKYSEKELSEEEREREFYIVRMIFRCNALDKLNFNNESKYYTNNEL